MQHVKNKSRGCLVALTATIALLPTVTLAQSVGEIGESLAGQTTQVNNFITILAFVLGVALAIAGLMKFYNNSKNPNDPSAKMSTAFILIFAGAGLVALPAVLGSGISTIFTDGATTTDATDGFSSLP